MRTTGKTIAVLVPCYNEAQTVGRVVRDFRRILPEAAVYVYDNNSTDETAAEARDAGAVVRTEPRQGKGNVVRAMFRDVSADIYVLVDGDATYPAESVGDLIAPILDQRADIVVGDRISSAAYDRQNTRPFHSAGNRLIRWIINRLYGAALNDILSGYRCFNRYFVKNFPVISSGFEIESEMTLHALDKKFRLVEIATRYHNRPEGSFSKLNTYRDGIRIIRTIALIFKNYKPLVFFTWCAVLCAAAGLLVGIFPIIEYLRYAYVYKVPSAILAAALEIQAMLFLTCGITLDTIVRQHREDYELKLNAYIQNEIDTQ
jgi:glycosyltransferase involved in cell wall biosynthesis